MNEQFEMEQKMDIKKIKNKLLRTKAELLVSHYELLDLKARLIYGNEFGILSKKEKMKIALEVVQKFGVEEDD